MIILLLAKSDVLFASSFNQDSSAYYHQKAIQFKQDHRINEAMVAYTQAIDFDASNVELRFGYIKELVEQRKFVLAINELEKIIAIDSNQVEALFQLTQINFQFNKWNEVISYGIKLLQLKEDDDMQYMLGKAYYEIEEYGSAKALLFEAVKKDATKFDRALLLGRVYIELSEYYNALNAYKIALDIKQDKDVLYEFGLLNYTVNNEKEAIKYYELAVEKGYKPDLDYTENLGTAYLAVDINKGVEILNTVLRKKPNNREILLEIAHAYFKKKSFQLAADTFYKVYMNDTKNIEALYMCGVAFIRGGEKLKGTEICDKALRFDPSLADLKRLSFVN